MANEITVTGSLSAFKPSIMSSAIGRSIQNLVLNMTGNVYVQNTVLVGVTITTLDLGQVTQPHWAFFLNKDATNYVQIAPATGQQYFPKLYPGEFAMFPMVETSAPVALANANPCYLEYLILNL